MSGLWPEGGGDGDPWVAFLPLEVEAASPGEERVVKGWENYRKRQCLVLCLCLFASGAHLQYSAGGCISYF